MVGIEPTTRALRMRCSTTELHRRRFFGVKVIARVRRCVKRMRQRGSNSGKGILWNREHRGGSSDGTYETHGTNGHGQQPIGLIRGLPIC
jgi:hypothetical protein